MGVGSIANTGLKAAMTNMEVISNNISNANTIGFKKSCVNFADIYSGGMSQNSQVGLGVKMQSLSQDFSMGRIELTDRGLDLSLNNDGFFVQKDSSGKINYTRAGRFDLDKDSFFIGSCGKLQGYPAINGQIMSSGALTDLKIAQTPLAAKATTNAAIALNLDSSSVPPVPAFSSADPASYNYRTDTTVYDSLGQSYGLSVFYVKTSDNSWTTQMLLGDQNVGTGSIQFNTDGNISSVSGMNNLSWTPTSGAASPQLLSISLTEATQFSGDNKTDKTTQDGYPAGVPTGFNIDNDGKINVYYTNGQTQLQGQMAIARFMAPQGLSKGENMSWQATMASGDPILDQNSNLNAINSGTVELSNVDLTEELVKLMEAQHDFQANAQVAQTYNQVLQTIENI